MHFMKAGSLMAAGHVHVKPEPWRMCLKNSSHRWRASQLAAPKILCSKVKTVAQDLLRTIFGTVDSYINFTANDMLSMISTVICYQIAQGLMKTEQNILNCLFNTRINFFSMGTSQNFQSFYSESGLALGFLLDVFLVFRTKLWLGFIDSHPSVIMDPLMAMFSQSFGAYWALADMWPRNGQILLCLGV